MKVVLYLIGCLSVAGGSVWLIAWLAGKVPPDRVSDKWLDDNIRERKVE